MTKYVLIGILTLVVILMITSNFLILHVLGGLLGITGGYILGSFRK